MTALPDHLLLRTRQKCRDYNRGVPYASMLVKIRSIFVILFFAFICPSCLDSDCSNEIIEELPSPDGKMKIVLFSRNCGATTDFNTQAMILNNNEKMPDKAGNVFIIDKGTAKVIWKTENDILVIFDPDVRVFKQETSIRVFTIKYQHKET